MSEMSEMIRKMFKEGDDIRDAGLTTPKDIERFDDIVYGTDPKWQIMDVYRPKGTEGKLPVIVSVHGGGWVYGDKERYQYYTMSLAQHGFAVINFTYRLAPEFTFPAPLEDTNLVMEWMMKNAEKYGFDTDHVFAVGDSAGAHLLSLYTCITINPDYAKLFDFKVPAGLKFSGLALNCGCYLLEPGASALGSTSALMADFLPNGGTAKEYEQISCVNFMNEKFPPVYLMTSVGDFLKAQAPIMQEALLKYDIPFVYHFFSDPEKKLGHVFHCNMKSDWAKKCNDEECDFFRSLM